MIKKPFFQNQSTIQKPNRMSQLNGYRNGWRLRKHVRLKKKCKILTSKLLPIYTNNKQCDNLTWYRLTGCTWVKDRFQCNLWAAVGTNQGIAVAHPNSCWFHRLKCYRIECFLSFSPVIPTFELIRRNLSLNATILLWTTLTKLQFICIYIYFCCK